MKPLQVILGFLLSVATLFFRSKRKHKYGESLVDGIGHPMSLPSESRDSLGGNRCDTCSVEADTSTTPINLLGWALIVTGAGGYLIKLLI